jgi:hypothetical protein
MPMPVFVDLAQFPRLVCPRCGLVALVDPTLPLDLHPSLTCPNCSRTLGRPPRAVLDRRVERSRAEPPPTPTALAPRVTGPVPSQAVVGLAIAGIFMLMLIGLFIWFLLNPHSGPGFGALTKP